MNEQLPLKDALPLIKRRLKMNYGEIAYYCHVTGATVTNWNQGKSRVTKIVSRHRLKELAGRAGLVITDVK